MASSCPRSSNGSIPTAGADLSAGRFLFARADEAFTPRCGRLAPASTRVPRTSTMTRHAARRFVHVLAFLVLSPIAAAAAEPDPLDRWSLAIGGFRAVSDTTVSVRAGVDAYRAEGAFNFEDDLGLDSRQPVAHVRFDVLTTPGRGQALSLDYFGFDREHEVRIDRSIVYDGYTYDAFARVRGRLDYDFASATYRWWLGEGATVWGVGAGLAYYKVDTLLEGEASFDGDS